jgi:two-component system LytT family response regulator
MLRVALVDDEPLARQGLRRMLAGHKAVEIVAEADRVSTATPLLLKEKPHAIFLDIHMPGADGFELLKTLDPVPKIVFVTAHSNHAVRAFDVEAVDYVLKPVRPERLSAAVSRLQAACLGTNESATYAPGDRICLRTPQRTVLTALQDIAALEAEKDFTRFHIAGETPLLICQSIGSYERTLPSPPFLRLSRSLMINTGRLARTENPSRNEMRLWLKGIPTPFRLGRTGRARLNEYLGMAA